MQREQNLYMSFYVAMDCCSARVCAGPQKAKVAVPAASQASVGRHEPSEEVGGISSQHYLIVLWQQVYPPQAPTPSTPTLSFHSPSHGRSRSAPNRLHHPSLDSIPQPCLTCLAFTLTLVNTFLKQERDRIVIFPAF